jgi:hypothetical protein
MTTPCSFHGCPEPAQWTLLGRLVPHCRVHMLDAMRATGFNHPAVRIPLEPEPQADIVERLRITDAEQQPVAILSWEQADQIIQDQQAEIARLRAELSGARKQGETGQPVLNGAERMAINSAIYLCEATAGLADENANATAWATCAATLRGLLNRLGGCPEREQQARKGEATPARSGGTGDDSPERAGSVDAPVAFGVTRVGGRWVAIFDNPVQAENSRQYFDACENREHAITPLYSQPQPTLTDAERDDIACAASRLESEANGPRDLQVAATLRGLLDRHENLPDREHPARKEWATPARSGETGGDSPDRE